MKKQQRGCCSSQPVRTVSGGSARGGLKATKAEAEIWVSVMTGKKTAVPYTLCIRFYLAMVAQTHGDPPLHPVLHMATSSVLVFTHSFSRHITSACEKCDVLLGKVIRRDTYDAGVATVATLLGTQNPSYTCKFGSSSFKPTILTCSKTGKKRRRGEERRKICGTSRDTFEG